MVDLDRERDCRTASSVSVLPLLAVAVSAFLPAVQACNQITTPAHEIARGAIWGLPPFVLAGVLAIASAIGLAVSYRRRPARARVWLGPYRQPALVQEPPRAPGRLAASSVALLSTVGVGLSALSIYPALKAGFALALALGCLHVTITWALVRRLEGWTRWTALHLLWAAQATFPVGFFLASGAFDRDTPGASLYVFGVAVVAAVTGHALGRSILRARRRRRQGDSGSFTFRNARQTSRS